MSDPGIAVNSTQVPSEIFMRLLGATEEIRDLLRRKSDDEKTATLIEAPHQSNGAPDVTDAGHQEPLISDMSSSDAANQIENSSPEADPITQERLNTDTRNKERDNKDNWPDDETIKRYKVRCAKHKSECEKMQVELGCFIAHLGVVRGNNYEIECAEKLQKGLLEPVQSLERAFDVAPSGRADAMGEIRLSFSRLSDLISFFGWCSFEEDALYPDKLKQWDRISRNGRDKIHPLVRGSKYVECLKFIHDALFSNLETAMGGVVEALTTFEEKYCSEAINEWLATRKIEVFEKQCQEYINQVFPSEVPAVVCLEEEKISRFRKHLTTHRKSCIQMQEELDHLIEHYRIIGGDGAVITASGILRGALVEPVKCLERVLSVQSGEKQTEFAAVITSFARLLFGVKEFQESLYHQKHAFYFRKVRNWVACVRAGLSKLLVRSHRPDLFLDYICNELLSELNSTMVGVSDAVKEADALDDKLSQIDAGSVADELKTFGKEALPKFLIDQMERDTTRYVNLTTIATFFSSVTATTLQFTFAATDAVPSNSLRGVVNLFWFLSLVFSVSSSVSSLLGLTWRKSSIYDSCVPPRLIRMWFDKAPMLFLIIAAVAFVLGLNLFAYLSLQPRFVSFATSIFTGLHGMCLLAVTLWFIYQLKHDSVWAVWIRTAVKTIAKTANWIIEMSMKWFRTCMKWIWKVVKRPYNKYKENLHLQRNIFWAFGIDNRVVHINSDIDWFSREWQNPCLLSRIIRFIVYPIKKGWLVTRKAFSDFGHFVRVHVCACCPAGRTGGDIESFVRERHEKTEGPEEIQAENLAENAENKFREALLTTFNDVTADWVMYKLKFSKTWIITSEDDAKFNIGKNLWGYPDLRKKFLDVVRPAWIDEREKARREIEEEQRHEAAVEHADIDPLPLGLEVADQEQDNIAPAQTTPPQASHPTSLHEGTEHLSSIQIEVKLDSASQLDHPPPPLDQHPPLTASSSPVTVGSTPADPNFLPSTPVIGTGVIALNEIEDLTSTSEKDNEEELGE